MDFHHLLVNLGFLLLSDDSGEDEEVLKFIFELRDPALTSVFKLKERGNCIFKESNHLLAFSYYKQAIKFLCLIDIPSTSEQQSCATSPTISLILNLAACEIKLSHFAEAWFYCNLVLICDHCNVKARYRMGLSSKNLNLFNEALEDFEAALKLDPKNKDITRELHSMVDCIAQNLSCKQVGYQFDPLGWT
ncbi:uncharacterized protein LOC141590119 [Silene latifolia]|uniref:uncharacterized protein LOC141590119 n=1 Tax=Silene latifolia TaxID=37657 RepID=UPI003D784CFB